MVRGHSVDITGLLSGSHQVMQVEDEVPIDSFEGIVFGRPARVRLRLRPADGDLEVRGSVDAHAVGVCDACLAPIEFDVQGNVDERLDLSPGGSADPFGDSNVLVGDRLDVADLAQQVVLSALPMGVRCSTECKGLCPACGADLNAGACSHT
jgi:uncharacterized protein